MRKLALLDVIKHETHRVSRYAKPSLPPGVSSDAVLSTMANLISSWRCCLEVIVLAGMLLTNSLTKNCLTASDTGVRPTTPDVGY